MEIVSAKSGFIRSKNEKENLSKAERNNIRKVIECLEHTVRS